MSNGQVWCSELLRPCVGMRVPMGIPTRIHPQAELGE